MYCSRIEELLKTDYLDGMLTPPELKAVREHLARCPDCAELEKKLLAQRLFFKQAKRVEPPPEIWENIRGRIISERLAEENRVAFPQRLRDILWHPRPVFALASIFAAIIMVAAFSGIFIRQQPSIKQDGTQVTTSGYSLNPVNGEVIYDLGTDIEKYFL